MKYLFFSLLLISNLFVACDNPNNEAIPTPEQQPEKESPVENEISPIPVNIDLNDAEKIAVSKSNDFAFNLLSLLYIRKRKMIIHYFLLLV
ncbi:hypothetical protein [Parabacteroides bouchesdurhonensis]|uniref:hypothetical protein n=1 Tax=Parabacteroides bouchesdurhonensis TaxID=1936995 RepID=UPI000E48D8CE|nr:hypothetical protein [Parabacteroides bouchesdurhonensis]RHJ92062.1 hypothetical protein DW095_08375 [Bacteroides sp. AM07-16]